MRYALALVLLLGTAFGLLVPVGKAPPAPAAPARVAAASTVPSLVAASTSPSVVAPPLVQAGETVLDRTPNGHFLAIADVNNTPTHFVVDTGADIVALTEADARQANVGFDPLQFQVIGRGAAGDVRGQKVVLDSLVLDGKRATNVPAVVIEGGTISLLGHSYLRQLQSVSIEGDKMRLR
ncbi:MAG: TIGR02281 family clan AA aspartic protease [Sphingomonas sp.]|nr:TIGR02281 family clan AA aspartic protease [Sphingomonas sp.]